MPAPPQAPHRQGAGHRCHTGRSAIIASSKRPGQTLHRDGRERTFGELQHWGPPLSQVGFIAHPLPTGRGRSELAISDPRGAIADDSAVRSLGRNQRQASMASTFFSVANRPNVEETRRLLVIRAAPMASRPMRAASGQVANGPCPPRGSMTSQGPAVGAPPARVEQLGLPIGNTITGRTWARGRVHRSDRSAVLVGYRADRLRAGPHSKAGWKVAHRGTPDAAKVCSRKSSGPERVRLGVTGSASWF